MRCIALTILLIVSGIGSMKCYGQETSNAARLVGELQNPATAEAAAQQLRAIAEKDQETRQLLAMKVPGLIAQFSQGPVWLSAVRLAGDLRIPQAALPLAMSLNRDTSGGSTTFAEYLRLDSDPVAAALVQIGDPAIEPVRRKLENGNLSERRRATMVLVNINSTKSKQVLHSHLARESDPHLSQFIRQHLDHSTGGQNLPKGP